MAQLKEQVAFVHQGQIVKQWSLSEDAAPQVRDSHHLGRSCNETDYNV